MAKEAEELEAQAERIRELRDERARQEGRRVPQPEVADAVGVTLRAYQAWEAGDTDPDPKNLKALADFYGVSRDFIEYGADGRTTPDLLRNSKPSDARLERIEAQLTELHDLLLGKDEEALAGLASRLLRAAGSPPSQAADEPETPPEAVAGNGA